MQTFPVCFCTDDNYALPTCVAIQSIKNNTPKHCDYKIAIYIIYDKLTQESIDTISLLKSQNVSIEFLKISNILKEYNLYSTKHYPKEMYFRFFIPELLNNYEKVLYLDSDIVANCDLTEFFKVELGNKVFGAILEYNNYFNSGVMIINTKPFAEENIKLKCIDFLKENTNLVFPDQDALNNICTNKVKYLDRKFNFFCCRELLKINYLKKLNFKKDIKVFHFLVNKPWKKITPFSRFWWKNANTLPPNIKTKVYIAYYKKNKSLREFIKSVFYNSILGLKIHLLLVKLYLKIKSKNKKTL